MATNSGRRRVSTNLHDGVVETDSAQARVAVNARVRKRGVLVATERKHRLVHLRGVENVERDEQVEVLDAKAGDGLEEVRFELRNDVLERVLAKVREIHERRNP